MFNAVTIAAMKKLHKLVVGDLHRRISHNVATEFERVEDLLKDWMNQAEQGRGPLVVTPANFKGREEDTMMLAGQ